MPPKRARTAPQSVTVRIHPKQNDDEFDDEDEHEFDEFDEDDDLGDQGDYECTRNFSGDVLVNGVKAGGFSATLVDREYAGPHFHSACDAESGELQEMSCVLFGSSGKPRYPALKSDQSAKAGGFLYIGVWNIDAAYCGTTDVGAQGIRALLNCPELDSRWSVASYIAEGRGADDDDDRIERFHAQMAGIPEDPQAKAARIAKIHDAQAKDARQFLRAGFSEIAYKDGGWLYVSRGMLQSSPLLSHEAALAVPLRLKTTGSAASMAAGSCASAPAQKDEELLAMLMRSASRGGSSADVLAQADRLVAEGANLSRGAVLHVCAANGLDDLLQPLISRGADVNFKDPRSGGATPLMVAATQTLSKYNPVHNRQQDTKTVAMLIALGADKNIVDDEGRSALGHYYLKLRSLNDFSAALLDTPKIPVGNTVKAMLTPTAGPTAVDRESADDH